MLMQLIDVAKLLSNGGSVTLVLLCGVVIYLFGHAAYKSIISSDKFDAQAWFVVGVLFTHLTDALDNIYWLVPWSMSFLGADQAAHFMEFGVYPNLFVRITLGCFATYCHIRSWLDHRGHNEGIANKLLSVAIAIGASYSLFLLLIR